MTLSHFQSSEGVEGLISDLEPLREVEVPAVRVESVSLEEFHPAELYPTRRTVEAFEL